MATEDRASTHAQRALIALRQRILSGELPGGTRLFEVALAEMLGISRTPVRAALSQLAEEALLDRAAGGGFVVRSFAVADVVDTIELRGVLEGTAARLAAERGAPADLLEDARDTLGRIDALFGGEAFDIEEYSRLNTLFHHLLARLSQSPVLIREIARIAGLPFASPSAFLDDPSRQAELVTTLAMAQGQHHAIIEAIRQREGFRAESLVREHARAARRNAESLLSDGAAGATTAPSLGIMTA
jgi:GntR family transcriptional regulator of vanillate catabolism